MTLAVKVEFNLNTTNQPTRAATANRTHMVLIYADEKQFISRLRRLPF